MKELIDPKIGWEILYRINEEFYKSSDSSMAERNAHNVRVGGSIPSPTTSLEVTNENI